MTDRLFLTAISLLTGDYAAVLNRTAYAGESPENYDPAEIELFSGAAHLVSAAWDQAERELNRYLDKMSCLTRASTWSGSRWRYWDILPTGVETCLPHWNTWNRPW